MDGAGNLVEEYDYDAYGNVSGTRTVGNPYYFTGRRFDEESGLYYYRARMYHPTIGRFMQRDPLGYSGDVSAFSYITPSGKVLQYLKPINETNPYLYTANNPINRIDPTGMWYIDINLSWIAPFGSGGTTGVMINGQGIWKYGGWAGGVPGPGASVTLSGNNPTSGLTGGTQAITPWFVGGQKGFNERGEGFWEAENKWCQIS